MTVILLIMKDYGDFESQELEQIEQTNEGPVRVRLPREGELLGHIVQRYGGNRMEVKCTDGKTRNCRVPGKYRRSLWLRPGDFILIMIWKDDDEKGDIIFKYSGSQVNQLRKRGLLDGLETGF